MEIKNIFKAVRSLFVDSSKVDQPKGTYTFALNAVKENDQGENTVRSNEEANESVVSISPGFVPIGKVYMTNNRVCIFSVSSDGQTSEIGIINYNTNTYTVEVNDALVIPKNKLKFKIDKQIEAVFRLVRGCEETVYWVDKHNVPRQYNFNKPEAYKNSNGSWVSSKFNLQKSYDRIPEFRNVEVLDTGGNIPPGSLNFSIQLVDASLNPTEWIIDSPTVKIYNDNFNLPYAEVTGSVNSDQEHINFPNANKSVKIEVANLDPDYLYYRIAIICANSGTGQVNKVYKSELIPANQNFYIYTGDNHIEEGTEEEILFFDSKIYKAGSIEQIENRLILANVEGNQTNYCSLQKYASKIKSDCIVKEIYLADLSDKKNSKNAVHEFNNGIGYMPGEIYSFGIVYIFEDMTTSPVFHIPGKRFEHGVVIFDNVVSPTTTTYPMAINNECETTTYTGNDSCGTGDYWGRDYSGQPLEGKKVRHHKFPLRSDINVPLLSTNTNDAYNYVYYYIKLKVAGDLKIPVPCPEANPTCGTDISHPFEIRVKYKVDGEDHVFSDYIDPNSYADGEESLFELEIYENSDNYFSPNITDIEIEITDINGDFQPITGFDFSPYFDNAPTITTSIMEEESQMEDYENKGNILGIKFSGIELPPEEITGGLKVVGYYIVRNERTEFEKTILDSGVMFRTIRNGKYVSSGLLNTTTALKSWGTWSIIHPEHKFNGKEYTSYDAVIVQGQYLFDRVTTSKINYDDVQAGTSFTEKMHKENDDAEDPDGSPTSFGLDGWSFNLIARDNIMKYDLGPSSDNYTINSNLIKESYYLDALESRGLKGTNIDVYNLAADNKIGIIDFNMQIHRGGLPFVYLYRKNFEPYANFRSLPYYKETVNPIYFGSDTVSKTSIYNGDAYITPMRYLNTVFYENRIAKRKMKVPAWKIVVGVLIVAVAVVISVFTYGTATPLAASLSATALAALVGTGIAVAGVGAMLISSGIKQSNFNKAYGEEYEKGLKKTVLDSFVRMFYNYGPDIPFGYGGSGSTGFDGPTDDTISWATDCATSLWFESSVNINLRNRFAIKDNPTYLYAPYRFETGNRTPIQTWKIKGLHYTNSNDSRYPVSSLERHVSKKLLSFDESRDDNKKYLGIPLGEYYHVNKDYHRRAKQKIYMHLPLEYDCCSDCRENFPHRVHYSEQSFQEELTDNYRIFLPNNYIDIDGNTGKIVDTFKIGNDLFIHTEEALWQLPRDYQERVTDQIVSFIGTGSYLSIPPRKIVDDDTGNSAGTRHKWGIIKTPKGVFFPSENQNKIFKFDGQSLIPISDLGLKSYFKENMEILQDSDYLSTMRVEYEFRDNPSNPLGTGFISTYDSKKDRVIFTKKDTLLNLSNYSDFIICSTGQNTVIFNNVPSIIESKAAEGWSYVGIEDCRMKFEKEQTFTGKEEWSVGKEGVTYDTDFIIQLDRSGSFTTAGLLNIKASILAWFTNFKQNNPDYQGNLYYLETRLGCQGQTWLRSLDWLVNFNPVSTFFSRLDAELGSTTYGQEFSATFPEVSKNFVVVSTVNEATIGYCLGIGEYHPAGIHSTTLPPSAEYLADFYTFRDRYEALEADGYYMRFLQYPVVYSQPAYKDMCGGMLQSVIFAIDGGNTMTPNIKQNIIDNINIYVSPGDYTTLINSLNNPNPYPVYSDGKSLRDFNWRYIHTRGWDSVGPYIISPELFAEDLNSFLTGAGSTGPSYENTTVLVEHTMTIYSYVDGEPIRIPKKLDNSWTLSFDIEDNEWISWHSYMPYMYINIPENFYSLVPKSNSIWKHGMKGKFQNYYGTKYPYILEFVVNDNPQINKIFDSIEFITEAYKYYPSSNNFVEDRFKTFNKAILYNTNQTTGMLNLVVKDTNNNPEDYFQQQIENLSGDTIIIDKNELNWSLNQIRDVRVDYNKPVFNKSLDARQSNYFIDKVIDLSTVDYDKNWEQQESLRDKYLTVRLIFDNFDDVKLLLNFATETSVPSNR